MREKDQKAQDQWDLGTGSAVGNGGTSSVPGGMAFGWPSTLLGRACIVAIGG